MPTLWRDGARLDYQALVHEAARATTKAEDIAAWCKQNMAVYKVPEIRIASELPMTATGKVKKEELAKLL